MKERVRNSVKAVIISGGKILLLQKVDILSLYSVLPGGGQKMGEALPDALRRECLEEINARVRVGALLFVRDYISANHEFADSSEHVHQVEFLFACELMDAYQPCSGPEPDRGQQQVLWVPLDALEQANFYPRALVPYLRNLEGADRPVYLGDVN